MKTVIRDTFLKQMSSIQKIYLIFIEIYHFYLKERRWESVSLFLTFITKKAVVHIRTLKQVLNHRLILKKVNRVSQFNLKAWLKPYIDMNTKLRTKTKNDFEKDFFKLMNNSIFRKNNEDCNKTQRY